jgi:hypothetical protein
VKLIIAHDPAAPYDKAVNALTFKQARNLKLRNLEIVWDKPEYGRWESALVLDEIQGLEIDGFQGRQAPAAEGKAAVVLRQVEGAVLRDGTAMPGTGTFVEVQGPKSKDIVLVGNDVRQAKIPYRLGAGAGPASVRQLNAIR